MIKYKGRSWPSLIFCLLVFIGLLAFAVNAGSRGTHTASAQTVDDYPLYVPLVYNRVGELPSAEHFDLAYVDEGGAWLGSFDGHYKALLTTDVTFGAEDDVAVIQVAPDGQFVAIQQTDGWAIYQRNTVLLASAIGQGFALTWERTADSRNQFSVLLAQKGHGIDRWTIADRSTTPLIVTSDETNDHSPLGNTDGSPFVFAHHEFGTSLYITLIEPFTSARLPYQGENHAAGKINAAFMVVEAVDSWHDQPIALHWSADEESLIFAAKATIYVVDMTTKTALTVTPPGFGERASGRAVDVAHDRILYFANGGLYVMGLDGQTAERVVEGDNLHYPQWTPGGQQIVYRGTDNRLYLVDADGSNRMVIPHTDTTKQFVLLP